MSEKTLFCIRRIADARAQRFRPLCAVRSLYLPVVLQVVEKNDEVVLYEAPLNGAQPVDPANEKEVLHIAYAAAQALGVLHGKKFCHGAVRREHMLRLADGGYVLSEPASTAADPAQDIRDWGAMVQELGGKGRLMHIAKQCMVGKIRDAKTLCRTLERLMEAGKRCLCAAGMAAVFCAVMITGMLGVQALINSDEPTDLPAAQMHAEAVQTIVPQQTETVQNAQCTCRIDHRSARIVQEGDADAVVFVPGEEMQVVLQVECTRYGEDCEAGVHDEVKLIGCRIDTYTEGGRAAVSTDGVLTVTEPGIFEVSGVMEFRGETYYAEPTSVYALLAEDMAKDCSCVFDAGKSRPIFDADNMLDESGMLYLPMHMREVIDDRLCTAEEHNRVHYAFGEVLAHPEGARCGVDEQNRFYCDTMGWYTLQLHFYFNGREESATCDMHVVGRIS